MLLLGLLTAAPALAQGPFWYHRALNGQGKGVKLSAQEPEEVRSVGNEEAGMAGKISGVEIEFITSSLQVKGIIYNNALQGQAKLAYVYGQPTLIKPKGTTCKVTVGKNNIIKVFGHQAWTWNGEAAQLQEQPQLNQKPVMILLGQELQQGAQGLPTNVPLFTVSFSGAGCVLAGAVGTVTGSIIEAVIAPANLGEYRTQLAYGSRANGTKAHFWNGTSNIGVESQLKFNNETAVFVQAQNVNTFGRQGNAAQEVALFGD
jgi:hypothetical protein